MFTSQSAFDVRFDWGLNGVLDVANRGRVAVIVDVLSFSTCVEIACARGARVLPYLFKDGTALEFARAKGALIASKRGASGPSLSPASLLDIARGTNLVLPSPNGSTLALSCTAPVVLAGCLRNASAVAAQTNLIGGPVTVIAAAERWPEPCGRRKPGTLAVDSSADRGDGSSRFAYEDLIGAGAILHGLTGAKSPEARAAEAAFLAARDDLPSLLAGCASGRELIERGFAGDVELAASLDVSRCVPRLVDGAFVASD